MPAGGRAWQLRPKMARACGQQEVRAAVSVTSGTGQAVGRGARVPVRRRPRMAATASRWLSREPAANISSNRTAPCAWRTWATRSASPGPSAGHARRRARCRRPAAAPASTAASPRSPSANASRANATRHSAMLRLMWIARLRSSASPGSARAPASWPPATSRVPSCTRDQAASQVEPNRSDRSCASCTPPLRDTVAALPWRPARLGPGSPHVIHSRPPTAKPDGRPSVPASDPVTGDYLEVAVKRSADCMRQQRFRCSPA